MRSFLVLITISLIISGCSVFKNSASQREQMVLISTNYGDMKIKLYNSTPQHRDNFLKLANDGFYDSLLFHRVINHFMIQGGAPDSRNAAPGDIIGLGVEGNNYYIPNEFDSSYAHKKGVLAAARDNNPERQSSGCQFYIVQGKKFTDEELDIEENKYQGQFPPNHRKVYREIGGTPHLYLLKFTVFGEVVEGMEVIDKIAALETDRNNRPVENVVIITVKVMR